MKAFLVFVSITLSVISIVQSAAAPNYSSNTQQQVKTSSEVASAYTTLLTQPITTDGWFYFTNFLSQYIPTFIGNNYQLHDELKEPLKSFKYVCLMMELLAKMDLYRNQPQGAIIRAKKMSTMYLKVITTTYLSNTTFRMHKSRMQFKDSLIRLNGTKQCFHLVSLLIQTN